MALNVHRAEQHRSAVRGIEACALVSNQSFPRHAHDQFGIGVIASGAQRSWSGNGPVEAEAGDIITVNPGEIHDGNPIQGRLRSWQMLYVDPGLLFGSVPEKVACGTEFARPTLQDALLERRCARLFAGIIDPSPDALAVEEDLLRTIAHVLIHYGNRPFPAQAGACTTRRKRSTRCCMPTRVFRRAARCSRRVAASVCRRSP